MVLGKLGKPVEEIAVTDRRELSRGLGAVALAYALMAGFLFWLSRAPAAASVPSMSGEANVVPAE